MEEGKSLEELLILLSQQGVTIAEQQKQISDLQSEMQAKDSQLLEALHIAEDLKAQSLEVSALLRENQRLHQQLKECDLRTEIALADVRKEYSFREQRLIQQMHDLQNGREEDGKVSEEGKQGRIAKALLLAIALAEILLGIGIWLHA